MALAAAASFLVPRQRLHDSGNLTRAPPAVSEERRSVAPSPSPPPRNSSGCRSPPLSAGAAAGLRRAHARAHAGTSPSPPSPSPRAACPSARAQRVLAAARAEEAGKPAGAGRWRRVRPGEELPGVGALQVRGRRRSLTPGRLWWARSVTLPGGVTRARLPGLREEGDGELEGLLLIWCLLFVGFSRGEHRVCREWTGRGEAGTRWELGCAESPGREELGRLAEGAVVPLALCSGWEGGGEHCYKIMILVEMVQVFEITGQQFGYFCFHFSHRKMQFLLSWRGVSTNLPSLASVPPRT